MFLEPYATARDFYLKGKPNRMGISSRTFEAREAPGEAKLSAGSAGLLSIFSSACVLPKRGVQHLDYLSLRTTKHKDSTLPTSRSTSYIYLSRSQISNIFQSLSQSSLIVVPTEAKANNGSRPLRILTPISHGHSICKSTPFLGRSRNIEGGSESAPTAPLLSSPRIQSEACLQLSSVARQS